MPGPREAETDALVRSATSSISEEVLIWGGTMDPRDADASRNENECVAGGFEGTCLPPESTRFSMDAYVSSTLGVLEATEVACLDRSGWGGEKLFPIPFVAAIGEGDGGLAS